MLVLISYNLGFGMHMSTKDLLMRIRYQLDEYSPYATDPVMQVLHKYTLRKLHDLLYKITNNGKYELRAYRYDQWQLRDFLAKFYALVNDTDALPLHTPNSGLSQIMMQVAIMLEKFFPLSNRLELLMPAIKIRNQSPKLHDFVMSDDNTRLIEVLLCLKLASEDGVLKHTCLFNNTTNVLSTSEKQRVTFHSKEANEYWNAIQNKIAKRTKLTTEACVNAEISLLVALASPNYQVTATYYGSKRSALLFEKLSHLPDLRDYVGNRTIEAMRRQRNPNRGGALITERRKAIRPNQYQEDHGRHRRPRLS
jgi:hypothetical protein